MKSYVIYLVRNGATKENSEGRYIGHTDTPLSEESAQNLTALKEEYVYPPVEALFSSPLKRCIETAQILYPEAKPIIMNDFIELDFGAFENKTAEQLKENEDFKAWLAGEPGADPPYGESNAHFAKRVCTAFEKTVDGLLKTGTSSAAIVTHGGVIMTILAAYGIPQLPMHEWICPDGGGYAVRINAQLWMTGKKAEVFSEFPYDREELPD